MLHPYISRGQAWVYALRTLMGYPPYPPTRHTMAFCTSGPRDIAGVMDLTSLAIEMQKDILHLTFDELAAQEPCKISLALHHPLSIEWLPGCRLYAASDRAPIELLFGDKRWKFDERNQLVARALPARHLLTRGEQIAWARWREAAQNMEGVELSGLFVCSGQGLADGVPVDALEIAN